MNKYQGLLLHHAKPLLGLDEKIQGVGYLTSGSILAEHYIAGVTIRRLVFVQLARGLFELIAVFQELHDFPFKSIESLTIQGRLRSKQITLQLNSGEQHRYNLNLRSQVVPDQRNFYEKLKENYQRFRSEAQTG